jgi:hypothetical protein
MIDARRGDPAPEQGLYLVAATPNGNSIVLLTESVDSTDLSPKDFADLGIAKPQNFVSASDLVVIDYGAFQLLVLPGVPQKMQVQVQPGRALIEAESYAKRFLAYAKTPRTIGMNFGWKFLLREDAMKYMKEYIRTESLSALVGGELSAAGVKVRFTQGPWRGLLSVDPGASASELLWQVNFERSAVTQEQVDEALGSIEELTEANAAIMKRLPWNT